jgi:hypothetical protein
MEATLEMPFVASLPVREKSKLAQAWDDFQELKALSRERGVPLPIPAVAKLLNVSVERIRQYVNDGRFIPVTIHERDFIFEDDIETFAKEERLRGRPVGLPTSVSEAWSRAVASRK